MTGEFDLESRIEELFRSGQELLRSSDSSPAGVPLTESDVQLLQDRGNSCSDWAEVFKTPEAILDGIENCRFNGRILLQCSGPSATVPDVIRNSMLDNVEIGRGCRIESIGSIRNFRIGENVTIENCSRISFVRGSRCGIGSSMELGVETGERNVPIFPYLDILLAEALSGGSHRGIIMKLYSGLLSEFLTGMEDISYGEIGSSTRIVDTPVIENCLVGPNVTLSNACAIRDSILLGDEESGCCVSDGSIVRNSVLQWESNVDSMAIVEDSIVGEAATVERQGLLSRSFLGPNSVLAQGEITATLAGPFTSAHHQSLLIAARWPEGKGNLGYGANVGSNHTSRLPDQEILPGEGMFFGLGCSVKFPADYSRSPFSIIATGITTLPQRVEFPFSLICAPFRSHDDVPPAYNQIIPAWVLSDNLFAVRRNEMKYRNRNRAKRWTGSSRIIREDTISLLKDAARRLTECHLSEIYTDQDIPGLGKNFLEEEHRKSALQTYRFHIRYFALQSVSAHGNMDELPPMAKEIIQAEFPEETIEELLEFRIRMEEEMSGLIRRSLLKDSARGSRMIDDYSAVRDQTKTH